MPSTSVKKEYYKEGVKPKKNKLNIKRYALRKIITQYADEFKYENLDYPAYPLSDVLDYSDFTYAN